MISSSNLQVLFLSFTLPDCLSHPHCLAQPAPDQDGTKYGSDPKVSPRGACGPFGIQYNHIMFGLSPAHPRVLGGASWRCGGLPWLVHESSHGIIYIYYIYILYLFIPVEVFVTECDTSRPVQNGFWLPFCAKNWPWLKPYCKGTPPWPDALYRFWGFATPVPTILYGVWRGLIGDHHKLDGFKTGMDNAQL